MTSDTFWGVIGLMAAGALAFQIVGWLRRLKEEQKQQEKEEAEHHPLSVVYRD